MFQNDSAGLFVTRSDHIEDIDASVAPSDEIKLITVTRTLKLTLILLKQSPICEDKLSYHQIAYFTLV